jgi:hypothetical protein
MDSSHRAVVAATASRWRSHAARRRLPVPSRRTFASAVVASAHCMSASLRHRGFARSHSPLEGTGSPFPEGRLGKGVYGALQNATKSDTSSFAPLASPHSACCLARTSPRPTSAAAAAGRVAARLPRSGSTAAGRAAGSAWGSRRCPSPSLSCRGHGWPGSVKLAVSTRRPCGGVPASDRRARPRPPR